MNGSDHWRRLVGTIAGAAVMSLAASCGDSSGGGDAGGDVAEPAGAAVKRAALESWATRVVAPTYEAFRVAAVALEEATASWKSQPTAETRTAAQRAWRDAMGAWQEAELFILGPAGAMGTVPGGRDLRDAIYSYPLINRCRVDQETTEDAHTDPATFVAEPVNVQGLDALEYLLFKEGFDNACAPTSTLNTSGAWAALGEAEITQRRATYAHTLAQLLVDHADALVAAWDTQSGAFSAELVTAGQGSAAFMTLQEALNAVSDALFYLDKETKDRKLARPAGLSECPTTSCPDAVESTFAAASKAHIVANLRGFQAMFLGAPAGVEGVGFDDILVTLGAESVATDMAARIEAALVAAEAIPGDLRDAVVDDRDSVLAAYAAVKGITDILKTQFLTLLDLEPPASAATDND